MTVPKLISGTPTQRSSQALRDNAHGVSTEAIAPTTPLERELEAARVGHGLPWSVQGDPDRARQLVLIQRRRAPAVAPTAALLGTALVIGLARALFILAGVAVWMPILMCGAIPSFFILNRMFGRLLQRLRS